MIHKLGFDGLFDIQNNYITRTFPDGTQSVFLFSGLLRNIQRLKSLEGIDIAWIEEAETVSRNSLDVLIPTIRKPDSEIWVTFNPDSLDDAVFKMFVENEHPDAIVKKVTWRDNKYFPEPLRREMEWMRANDYSKYLWVWEGEPRAISDALIFKDKFTVEDFKTPGDAVHYLGADFGFSADPSTLIRCHITGRELFIDAEWWALGATLEQLTVGYATVPESTRWPIIADSSRPETIDYIRRHGFPKIRPSKKGKGSIEDGIEYIKSFDRVVIHPRCVRTIQEFKTYSYKTDPRTGMPTPYIIDASNHMCDSLRYALEPARRHRSAVRLTHHI